MLGDLEHRNVCCTVAYCKRDRRPKPSGELAESIPLVRTGDEVGLKIARNRGHPWDKRAVDLLSEQRTSPSIAAPVRPDRQ